MADNQANNEDLQGFADPNLLYGDAPDKNTDAAKPPVPKSSLKQQQGVPKPRKPPAAMTNASFLKPTVTSEIRKTSHQEPQREKSIEFIRNAKEKFSEECTFQPKINPSSKQVN